MANKVIKGLTVEIGGDTTKLGKAIESVEKKSASLSSELGEINRLLKFDPKNTELLAQKQKVLADAVVETSKKLDTLKEAERQVQAQFERGEVSEEQVRALQREIIATEKKLNGYKKAVEETAEQVEQLGKESTEAAKDVDKVGDSADDAEEDVSELDKAIADGGTAIGIFAGAVGAASAALVALTEESREYRREMGKLETAFADNNHSAEAAQETYEELVGVLGETDQAVEAANHLANIAETEEELQGLTKSLIGVYAKFGASLPVEGLAEAAAEVSKTGILTGGLTDAINWGADATETFGVKLKAATAENEEFNKKVEEATNAEEFFQIALDECADEQERQELIMKTLNDLYGDAADAYKETNKSVIEANKANDKWNKTLAKTGEKFDPVLTDIKVFGATLVEDMEEPIESIVDWVAGKFLPALTNFSSWVKQNIPAIKANLVGITAALVAYKVAVIAAEVAQKGLKGAIMATEAAQKALNLVMNANPYALLAAAVLALVAGYITYAKEADKALKATSYLTEEEQKLQKSANEAAEALREQANAANENEQSVMSQMGHVQSLADELMRLADESGRVEENDRSRAQFILGELNDALGTEYTMTDGVVQKYGELKQSIYEVIQAKTANALLEANSQAYLDAINAEATAWTNLELAEKDYLTAKENRANIEQQIEEQRWLNTQRSISGYYEQYPSMAHTDNMLLLELESKLDEEKKIEESRRGEWEKSLTEYENNQQIINDYRDAETAIIEGNYEKAKEILVGKSQAYTVYADEVDEQTARTLDTLKKQAVDAGLYAEQMKEKYGQGIDGIGHEAVVSAEKSYEDAMNAWANAYADAHSVGEDLDDGLTDGMESKKGGLFAKAKSIVSGIIGVFRKEADSHSPARKMIEFGHDLDDGVQIGMEEGTKGILQTAQDQVQGILDRYEGTDKAVNDSIQRGFVAQNASSQAQAARMAANNATMLDKILQAIEAGQIIALDGDKVVGGTYNRINNKFGQDMILAGRGAK